MSTKKTTPVVTKITAEEAKQIIAEQNKKDIQDCQKVINETLVKFGCKLLMNVQIHGDRVVKEIGIVKEVK